MFELYKIDTNKSLQHKISIGVSSANRRSVHDFVYKSFERRASGTVVISVEINITSFSSRVV